MDKQRVEVKWHDNNHNFVSLYVSGKVVGLPISYNHYMTMYNALEPGGLTQYLMGMTPQEWDLLHLSSVLDWRRNGITG